MSNSSYVVITEAPQMDYSNNYAVLPSNYGTEAYFNRDDVKAIRESVFKNLSDLNEKVGFSEEVKHSKRVLIKPNLVSVYHKTGFKDEIYPESTDPRVFEAVVSYMHQFNENLVIIESSGKGMPTSASFKISGLDRVASYYGCGLVALENEPVKRYMLPKAEVMKEVLIPQILDEVVNGESYYISVPKMKTNLYTGVTLGFKNAMGTIPYNLRERNHNYLINKKLVDLLYLFKPNLVVIDGIIGGEGCTPAPVDPVDVRVIISGNNSVETDRVATEMMGFDPKQNKLISEAVKRGFNDPGVSVAGEQKVTPFRPGEASMMDDRFIKHFPNVKVLVGHMKNGAPNISDLSVVTPELVRVMEKVCDGGCLPAVKTAFEMMVYCDYVDRNFEMVVILGAGVELDGKVYYFDAQGQAYSIEDIKKMKVKKVSFGECTRHIKPYCEFNGYGCCSPSSCMMTPFKAIGKPMPLLSFKNRQLLLILRETIRNYRVRRSLVRRGYWIDCPSEAIDKIYPLPELSPEDYICDYIPWPLPVMTAGMKKTLLKDIKLIV